MLTVMLPTYNGSDTIDRTLAALAKVVAPPGGWKLVVVNNASTDNTEELILRWKDRLPMELVFEPRKGKTIAQNTGITRMTGDLLVMTDDDVIPYPDWLVEWRRVADTQPEYALFGGAIEPLFEVPPPQWLKPAWRVVLYASTELMEAGAMAPKDIFGPNMVVRRSVIDEGHLFNESMGMGQGGLIGDETEFGERIGAAGHKALFVPTARVRHIVNASQISFRWIWRRWVQHGRTMYIWHLRDRPTVEPEIFHAPRWAIRRMATSLISLPLIALSFDLHRLFSQLRNIAYNWGTIRQARIVARQGSFVLTKKNQSA